MFKIEIIKNEIVTNEALFETEALADAWLAQEMANGSFGLNERPEMTDTFPSEPTGNTLPAEYQVVKQDVTASEALKKAKEEAQAYLQATDWIVVKLYENQLLGGDGTIVSKYSSEIAQRGAARVVLNTQL